jgi:uncharacterized protein YjeT (DUF2065 family)
MLVWQGLQFLLFIKALRRAWAFLERRSDVELQRVGVAFFLVAFLLVCVT